MILSVIELVEGARFAFRWLFESVMCLGYITCVLNMPNPLNFIDQYRISKANKCRGIARWCVRVFWVNDKMECVFC